MSPNSSRHTQRVPKVVQCDSWAHFITSGGPGAIDSNIFHHIPTLTAKAPDTLILTANRELCEQVGYGEVIFRIHLGYVLFSICSASADLPRFADLFFSARREAASGDEGARGGP